MTHHRGRTWAIVSILIAATFVALVAITPLRGIPVLLVLIIYMLRHAEDLGRTLRSTTVWIALPIIGGALFLLGVVVDSLGGGETAWWPLAVGPAIIGGPLLVITLVLETCHEVSVRVRHRHGLVPGRVRAASAGIALGALALSLLVMGEERGWAIFMIVLLSMITLAVLAVYAMLLHLIRPRGAAAV